MDSEQMPLVGSWNLGGRVFPVHNGIMGNMQLLLESQPEAERNGKKCPCFPFPSTNQSLTIVFYYPNPIGSLLQGNWGNVGFKGLKRNGSESKQENYKHKK